MKAYWVRVLPQFLVLALLAMGIAACGGGGGGSGGSVAPPTAISVSPGSVKLYMSMGGSSVSQNITASFKGSGVLVGYPPNASAPEWLNVQQASAIKANNQVDFTLSVDPSYLANNPGTYTTTLRFLTGLVPAGGDTTDATNVVYQDVPVTLEIVEDSTDPLGVSVVLTQGSTVTTGNVFVTESGDWSVNSDQSWLTVSLVGGSGSQVLGYSVKTSGLAVGNYTGTITVADAASGLNSKVLVNLAITAVQLVSSPTELVFNVDAGTTAAQLSQTLNISDQLGGMVGSSAVSWSVSTLDMPQLSVSPDHGSSAPGVVATVSLSAAQLSKLDDGTYTTTINLANTTSDGASHVLQVPVTINLSRPAALPALSFAVDATTQPGNLSQALDLSAGLLGGSGAVNWTFKSSDVPWLAVSPASAKGGSATVSVLGSQLGALTSGKSVGNLSFAYTTPTGLAGSVTVPVNLQLSMPQVTSVAPHVVSAQSPYPIILRGAGFSTAGNAVLTFGGVTPASYSVISDSEIHLTYPALSAGSYSVQFSNNLGINYGATLVVKNDGALPAGSLALVSNPSHLLFDNARRVLYDIDVYYNRIDVIALKNNAWVLQGVITPSEALSDAALSMDGRSLVVVMQSGNIFQMNLNNPGAALSQTASLCTPMCYGPPYALAFNNMNKAVITGGMSYDPVTYTLQPIGEGGVGAMLSAAPSLDGSKIWFMGWSYNDLYTSSDNSVNVVVPPNQSYASLNRDGSIALTEGGTIVNGNFTVLGSVDSSQSGVMAPDGSRVYVEVVDQWGAPMQINVYDTTATPQLGKFPLLKSIPLPSDMDVTNYGGYSFPFAMAISNDGLTLFAAGNQRVVVIPLP